jgi:hypothetical protein
MIPASWRWLQWPLWLKTAHVGVACVSVSEAVHRLSQQLCLAAMGAHLHLFWQQEQCLTGVSY